MKIIALVTLYFPSENVKENMENLANYVDQIYLIDNTPKSSNEELFDGIRNAIYMPLKENLGLSAAYNKCLKNLKDNSYIIFFDQDSFCPEGLIESLKKDYSFVSDKLHKKGIIGPSYYEANAGKVMLPKSKKNISEGIYEVSSIITSGLFTELEVIKDIGYWNENIFLDMADWDLCWRVKKEGLFCALDNKVILQHRLGKAVHKLVGLSVKEGAAFRIYYQIRDCLYLLKENYVPVKYKIRFILMLTVRPVIHLVVLPNKKDRIHFYFKGLRDYKKKIHGCISEKI